jgi:hypothetical protein
MMRTSRIGILIGLIAGMSTFGSSVLAGTIIKLDLVGMNESSTPSDISYNGTTLSTIDDLDSGTPGLQDTAISYLDVLSGQTDVPSPQGSFTLLGLTKSGAANVPMPPGGLVIQNFTGGSFELYGAGPAHTLLLKGTLANSALAGPLGPPATGALFTTGFATITDGSLKPLLDPNNLTLSMTLGNINGGAGLAVSDGALQSFQADSTLNMADTKAPEPSTAMLALIGGVIAAAARFRRGRS